MSNSPRVPFPKVSDRMHFQFHSRLNLLWFLTSCNVDLMVQNVNDTSSMLLLNYFLFLEKLQNQAVSFNIKGPTFLFFTFLPNFKTILQYSLLSSKDWQFLEQFSDTGGVVFVLM